MSEHLILTLGQIRAHRPCVAGWRELLAALGYPKGAFDQRRRVSLGDVARSNNVSDALWCVRCLPNTVEVRRAVVGLILPTVKRAVQHTTDTRVHDCISLVGRWQAGDDGVDISKVVWGRWVRESPTELRERAAMAVANAVKAVSFGGWSAKWAADAAASVFLDDERGRQRADIIAASPLLAFAAPRPTLVERIADDSEEEAP